MTYCWLDLCKQITVIFFYQHTTIFIQEYAFVNVTDVRHFISASMCKICVCLWSSLEWYEGQWVNPLWPRHNGWHFAEDLFECISFCENFHILISLQSLFNDNKSTLVQVVAWCCQARSHYLNQCWPRSAISYSFPRPLWVEYPSTGLWVILLTDMLVSGLIEVNGLMMVNGLIMIIMALGYAAYVLPWDPQ